MAASVVMRHWLRFRGCLLWSQHQGWRYHAFYLYTPKTPYELSFCLERGRRILRVGKAF